MTPIATIRTTDLETFARTLLAIAEANPGACIDLTDEVTVYQPADPDQLRLVDIDERLQGHVPA